MSATGISKEIETAGQLEELRQEVRIAAEELLSAANMKPGQILVVGCSSSEIASHKIGSYSSAEIGKAVFEELYAVTKSQGLYLAAQCCEHLNRALIVEEEAAKVVQDPDQFRPGQVLGVKLVNRPADDHVIDPGRGCGREICGSSSAKSRSMA